jgi:hypothetical protein
MGEMVNVLQRGAIFTPKVVSAILNAAVLPDGLQF